MAPLCILVFAAASGLAVYSILRDLPAVLGALRP